MTKPEPRFSDYGDGGDEVGARRSRRAFRWSVLAVVLLTGMLFVSENFLRYEHTESLYRSAISYPVSGFPSARTVLRSAVKQDEATHKTPTAKYVEALAEREEEDRILPTYAKAYKLDPNNAFLTIRYGCALASRGKERKALDMFRESSDHAPRNALPMYLEASVMPFAEGTKTRPEKSLALIARTNSSGDRITFPRPLWSTGLPQSGACYQELRRHIIDECCAPLLRYADYVKGLAETHIKRRQVQNWDTWLETLRVMGNHLATHSDPGSRQVLAGLTIQLDAIRLHEQVRQIETGKPDADLVALEKKTEKALAVINQFEDGRDALIAQDRERYEFPKWLWVETFSLMICIYFAAIVLAKIMRPHQSVWTIHHKRWGWVAPALGCAAFLGLLAVEFYSPEGRIGARQWISTVWFGIYFTLVSFGLVYPVVTLARPKTACAQYKDEPDYPGILKKARRARRAAVMTLMRRYYGLLGGLLLCTFAVWVLAFRITTGIYPHYVDLLTTGLATQESQTVTTALADLK